ncbi:MAG: formylglycine-generating enzyme family protein [Planctomycetales bacterium]
MPIGLVAERPPSGRFVQTERGWMVPYSMTIPGTEVAFEMVPIPGGDFRMGSPAGEKGRDDDEGPQFTVRVEPFWMGKHEVTWAEYRCYMETLDLLIHLAARGVRPQAKLDAVDAVTTPSAVFNTQFIYGNGEDPRLPAATMTQFAVRQYTKWLSGLTASFHRLPNEAEWEYACRAGTTSAWHFGDDPRQLGDYAWYEGSSDDTTHRVGLKKSNLWGIHDMHGNVAEWVLDQYDPRGYARAEGKTIPADAAILWPTKLGPRVLRGGCYESQANECRSAARFPSADDEWQTRDANFPHSPWWYNDEAALTVGFRIVRPLTEPPAKERVRFWDADTDSIRQAVKARQPFTAIGVADPKLAEEFKKHREQ